MSEHRLTLDPSAVTRLSENLAVIEEAWQGDIAELRRVEGELEGTMRLLNAATDRANDLQADLRSVRQENADLLKRNAHLEAQVQSLFEKSRDAQEALGSLANHAVGAARTAPPRSVVTGEWKDPEKNPPGDDDGTDLPSGAPAFISHAGTARMPLNNFVQQPETPQ